MKRMRLFIRPYFNADENKMYFQIKTRKFKNRLQEILFGGEFFETPSSAMDYMQQAYSDYNTWDFKIINDRIASIKID